LGANATWLAEEDVRDWVFTFYCDYRIIKTTSISSPLADCYVVIHGTHAATRKAMFAVYGDRWAFQYPSREEAGVERFGLREVPFGTPNPECVP